MKPLLVLPLVIPMVTAALALLAWRARRAQRVLAAIGSLAHFAVALALLIAVSRDGIQAIQIGAWPAPFGVTFVADLFSGIMVVMAALMGVTVTLYSLWSMDPEREAFGYYPLLNILLMGVSGAFLTGDIFNLYVCFEVMLMASFVLLALGGERAQLEGAIKYVTLNLISSALFLAAVGILYGVMGTLNMADLATKLHGGVSPGLATTLAMLFLVAFGIKAAVFPLFFWLPASYHTPPAAVSAIFAGLLTKVGVYSLIRVFTLLFTQDTAFTHGLLLVIASLTMLTGVLGAASQNEFRRILSFHIVSQIGYMIMGLGLFTELALAGSVFFIAHNIVVKSNLFLISGVAFRLRGSYDLKRVGGLYRSHPVLSVLFLIAAMSLAGVPPLSGFFGKLALVVGGLESGAYGVVAISLFVSLLTLYSMTKIWAAAFWSAPHENGDQPAERPAAEPRVGMLLVPIGVLAALTVAMGVGAEFFLGLAMRASEQLLNNVAYIEAVQVLGVTR